MAWLDTPVTAFEGGRCIASGSLREVALATKSVVDASAHDMAAPPVLVFENASSEVMDLDWRGNASEFMDRLNRMDQALSPSLPAMDETQEEATPTSPRGRGRPKLGVAAREVTLLPRHWEWLGSQPGGASVALRKLVETARLASETADRKRQCGAVTYKFMSTMAGHEAGFEEAARALFAGDAPGFRARIKAWPKDVQTHLAKISGDAFLAL